MPKKKDGPELINLRGILRRRFGYIPGFAGIWLEHLVCQDTLNKILREAWPARGVEFATRALEILNIKVRLEGAEKLPKRGHRCIFVCNHPLGGLDGIALISRLGQHYASDGILFPVNDMLLNVKPLEEVFVPVNKFGSQGREGLRRLDDAFASDSQILFFPAGLVSRLGKGGKIADLEWHKSFVTRARKSGRDIVPLYFEGYNTMRFYRTASMRKKLGLKFNIEQVLLPSELVRAEGKQFTIHVGKTVNTEKLLTACTPSDAALKVREMVYSLPEINKFNTTASAGSQLLGGTRRL